MDIYEDARAVSRADLAAWLRQLANQLESDGKIFYGAAGAVAVADRVTCELEIERDDDEVSVEIEFSWTEPAPAAPAKPAEQDTAEEDTAAQAAKESDEATPAA
ncbi:amphi-Trp domain-containing protein [Micromonospora krabiensis]|uniref:Amphi-Trp domain-containing protein n=1 Tax=Micromonospora krabiensis TaxID=307121 RepID=A0A1C3N369_9ACTN|nr:amphi-Trp domain-containing protein [Micromonospora krabiensis]SBV27042.1 amphi-Trp domain-containing protein [Micromonospora krabiensis]